MSPVLSGSAALQHIDDTLKILIVIISLCDYHTYTANALDMCSTRAGDF